jgi:hypothetical protein
MTMFSFPRQACLVTYLLGIEYFGLRKWSGNKTVQVEKLEYTERK